MDTLIAIELGVLIALAFAIGSRVGDANTAMEQMGPHLTRLEKQLGLIESAVADLKPRYDTNPHPYPDYHKD